MEHESRKRRLHDDHKRSQSTSSAKSENPRRRRQRRVSRQGSSRLGSHSSRSCCRDNKRLHRLRTLGRSSRPCREHDGRESSRCSSRARRESSRRRSSRSRQQRDGRKSSHHRSSRSRRERDGRESSRSSSRTRREPDDSEPSRHVSRMHQKRDVRQSSRRNSWDRAALDKRSDDESISSDWIQRSDENKTPSDIPPNFRVWEPVNIINDTQNGDALRFKLVSYNVLAQYLLECHPYLYTDCSPRNLKWKVRAAKLYNEILQLTPDIFCLQEVQVSHLKSFYGKFEELGYFGIFKQKTGHRQDGCAIYFKEALFHMQDQISVEFYQPELPILNRDNIGLMVKLAPKNSPTTPFVVATTHLLYNPKRTDVRLAQLQVLLAEIDRFAYSNNGRESIYLPTILTGDLNSTPDSAVIQLLNRGYVSAKPYRERDDSDFKKIGVTDKCQHLAVYLNRQKGVPTDLSMTKLQNTDYETGECSHDANSHNHSELFNTGDLGHSLKLKSVYDNVKCDGSTEATTFQDYWITVDYIYFSRCSTLRLVERLRLPTEQECQVLGQIPNDKYGSDHLALAATFELKSVKANL